MKYKVIPYVPALDRNNPSGEAAASHLNTTISLHANEGWKYVRIETLTVWVVADKGCFGFGGSPGYNKSIQTIVFQQES